METEVFKLINLVDSWNNSTSSNMMSALQGRRLVPCWAPVDHNASRLFVEAVVMRGSAEVMSTRYDSYITSQ